MKLSLVINCDTRNQNDQFTGVNLGGCVNEDMLFDGLLNKIKFFDGFDKEVIVYVDRHELIPAHILKNIEYKSDTLIVRSHTNEPSFNDWNYIRALSLATGDIIVHVDQDTAMFTRSKGDAEEMISLLQFFDWISYPSHWSPDAVHDDSFDHRWCSTRFFLTKKETWDNDYTEIVKCLKDYDYWCEKYPVKRKCHWLEHIIGSIDIYKKPYGKGVLYPKIELEKLAIFSWGSYKKGTLQMLNNMPYEEVRKWLETHPIVYPNDVHV